MNVFLFVIEKFKRLPFLQIFTIYLRYLIGGAFVIASIGMGKFSGGEVLVSNPGASIATLDPIGQFFRVMATSGLYWQFIGWSQIISGALLMTQRYAKLGAALFFPIILNIFVITLSYHFKGTPVITGLMLLATIFLVLWDLNSFQYLFISPSREKFRTPAPLLIIEMPYWSVTGTLMLTTLVVLALSKVNTMIQLISAFTIGLLAFIIYATALRRR